MKREYEEPDSFAGIDEESYIHFFGPNPPVFSPGGCTHLSTFTSGYVGPAEHHRPVRFGYTTDGVVTGDIKGGCSRSSPQYPAIGDHGRLCVLYVQKTEAGIKVVKKWSITAEDRDAMFPRNNIASSSDSVIPFASARGSAPPGPIPPTPPAGIPLLTNEQIMDLLNDPDHGIHIREMVSMAVTIRDLSARASSDRLKKFKQ